MTQLNIKREALRKPNQKKRKLFFVEKSAIFLVENLPEMGQNWFNSKTTIVPSPHEHS